MTYNFKNHAEFYGLRGKYLKFKHNLQTTGAAYLVALFSYYF